MPAVVALRARIVLWSAEGRRRKDIAELAGMAPLTVDRCKSRYTERGVAGLPQPRQPTPTHPLRHHSPSPRTPPHRSTLKTRILSFATVAEFSRCHCLAAAASSVLASASSRRSASKSAEFADISLPLRLCASFVIVPPRRGDP
ncbi:helix-turn-helix domain-containing protein [Streptomyces sp. R28]|uniref:Helix-turn-helix domain-containing protein n=1 Tax=Streptomyces sp. R28 TaxID=3238628 RepID=A0AB39QFW3_9ACTN